jgi:hypothetical protein
MSSFPHWVKIISTCSLGKFLASTDTEMEKLVIAETAGWDTLDGHVFFPDMEG